MSARRYCDLTIAEIAHLNFCESWNDSHRCPGPTEGDWDRYDTILQSIEFTLFGLDPEPEPTPDILDLILAD